MPAPIIRKIPDLARRINGIKPNFHPYSSNINDTKILDENLYDGSNHPISNLFDGNPGLGQIKFQQTDQSPGAGPEGWQMFFDLGQERTIERINIFPGTNTITAGTSNVQLRYRIHFFKSSADITNTYHAPNPGSPDGWIFDNMTSYDVRTSIIKIAGNASTTIAKEITADENGVLLNTHKDIRYIAVQHYKKYEDNVGVITSFDPTDIRALSEIDIYESFDTRDYDVQFDDALLDLQGWTGPRYRGCKLTGKEINTYTSESSEWKGDTSYGLKPVLTNKSTALYITNTVIGGLEDEQFATIQNHSYVNIQKILIINPYDDTVKIVDRESMGFEEFHRYITGDFPTGGRFSVRFIDDYISGNPKPKYTVKMNKGWLLKSMRYASKAGPLPGMTQDNVARIETSEGGSTRTMENVITNPLSLYDAIKGMIVPGHDDEAGVLGVDFNSAMYQFGYNDLPQRALNTTAYSSSISYYQYPTIDPLGSPIYGSTILSDGTNTSASSSGTNSTYGQNKNGELRFRYGTIDRIDDATHYVFQPLYVGDNTTFYDNKFTRNFVDPTNDPKLGLREFNFPFIEDIEYATDKDFSDWVWDKEINPSSTASVFIGQCVHYLNSHSLDTELHLTLFEGTKDFSGINDELSISTFEVDKNLDPGYLDFDGNTPYNSYLGELGYNLDLYSNTIGPRQKYIKLKNQPQFKPHHTKIISGSISGSVEWNGGDMLNPTHNLYGINHRDGKDRIFYELIETKNYRVTVAEFQNSFVYGPGTPFTSSVAGQGVLEGLNQTADHTFDDNAAQNVWPQSYDNRRENSMNFSGSEGHNFTYELSFLDKDHTLIADIDKASEFFNGIGGKGLVLIPEHSTTLVKNNIEFYLEKAGIISDTTATKKDTTNPD